MSKIELSRWQNPEDGFPGAQYFDAVVVALEKAGIGVHDSWRDERWDAVIELDRSAFNAGDFPADTEGLLIGWRVDEESDPLHQGATEYLHGFQPVGGIAGWWWMPTKSNGEGIRVEPLAEPLDEPAEVAAAVAALVRPEPKEN